MAFLTEEYLKRLIEFKDIYAVATNFSASKRAVKVYFLVLAILHDLALSNPEVPHHAITYRAFQQ